MLLGLLANHMARPYMVEEVAIMLPHEMFSNMLQARGLRGCVSSKHVWSSLSFGQDHPEEAGKRLTCLDSARAQSGSLKQVCLS